MRQFVDVVLTKAGRVKIRYRAALLGDDGSRVSVVAPWSAPGVRDFGFVRFEPGDQFTEHYWRDRWYAVKEVRTGDGTLKGWYCDITRPAEVSPAGGGSDASGPAGPVEIVVEDLDLDLWVSADGSEVLRLDEDEFAASGLAGRDPEAARQAMAALDGLERLAKDGGLPGLLEG
ncbi:DUF402 domain-containing protein [Streptomyces sp. LP05-1]|uniref:DUF402 domain-containing protein n=1 Tax=Streptomyces pyxinae TaxID=2970734 RepID=A0ABT2CRB4_9ACTN|nr:DUF402 domain-containing protein [Streptomyces sp. LP05-1]MCS0639632.1 DUF402 domain-containing protein [Streptomyces sp. LP05-1]